MDISPRKPCKRIAEPVDEWLHSEGFFRKHAPRDPTCLFRAVSEQVYLTQHFHIRVRQECVKYMRDHRELFEESIGIPFDSYLEQMSYFTEWGGQLEIKAMSLLYRRDVVMFNGQKLNRHLAAGNGFENVIYLCHIPPKQYESVYAREFISAAAFCQSIVYQTLYKDVFEMSDVDNTVYKMLRGRNSNVSHDQFFLKENLEIRDQLTVDLFNKIEKNGEDIEEPHSPTKCVTPFPYRIAKALDPNIYRNTDFDIWHEIRKEVRNAGWTRYNCSDLQVGGKCFVLMDTKEDEFDVANNNSVRPIGDKILKDANGNEQKISPKKCGKKDPLVCSGHIQEMGKNEGPVVVFIEELGEKKTVPYSSLKPITPKKNKQSNWPVINHKRNTIFEPINHKWKKSNWYGNSRKIKDLALNLNSLTTTQTDKNNNKLHSQDTNQWDNESGHSDESSLSYKTYTMKKLTAYQGYAVNTTIDVMPVSVVLDNPGVTESLQNTEEKNATNAANTADKPKTGSDLTEKQISITPVSAPTPEIVPQAPQNCNQNTQSEIYYPQQSGIAPYLPGTGSVYYPGTDCSLLPSPHYFIGNGTSYSPPTMDSLHPVNHGNQLLQPVNTVAQKSVEPNYSDLPLSDLATVRFFYNLGIEYFRSNCGWMGCGTSQSMTYGTCYVTQANAGHNHYNNPSPNNLPVGEVLPISEEISQLSQNVQQKLAISQHQVEQQPSSNREYSPSNGKAQGRGGNPNNHGSQNPMNRNDQQNISQNKSSPNIPLTQQSSPYTPNSDKVKESSPPNKDNQRTNRNCLAPRFKKNFDGRYRNSRQQQQQQQPQSYQHQHQQNHGNIDVQSSNNVVPQNSHVSEVPPPVVTAPVHNLPANTGNSGMYQNPVGQVPYSQPPMYATVPYYPAETESSFQNPYYPSNQGFSIPYIPHSDISDGNNVNHYPPNVYQGGESYGQPYPLYPQYVYPPGMYPTIPPQNTPESWYAMQGQTQSMPVPHYVQYSPTPASMPSSPNAHHNSNVSK